MSMYLELFHGRKTTHEDMDGWGFAGPVIGPLEHMTFTYMNIVRIFFRNDKVAKACGFEGVDDNWISFEDDLVDFQGNYYGDFSLLNLTKKEAVEMRKQPDRIKVKKYIKAAPEVVVSS